MDALLELRARADLAAQVTRMGQQERDLLDDLLDAREALAFYVTGAVDGGRKARDVLT